MKIDVQYPIGAVSLSAALASTTRSYSISKSNRRNETRADHVSELPKASKEQLN